MAEAKLSRADRSGEAPFGFDELFFSRTDLRGVITACNHVFLRVADFTTEEILGAPHRIVRHPEMPKAVFWLLWDRIQQREPIGAFVLNRAKDGLPYWVFAVVTPVRDGYLSVRVKPSGELFDQARALYQTVLQREKDEKLSPQDSAAQMLKDLSELGFRSYKMFMARALSEVIDHRQEVLGHDAVAELVALSEMRHKLQQFRKASDVLAEMFAGLEDIPVNMTLRASQMQSQGAPIKILSDSYRLISRNANAGLAQCCSDSDIDGGLAVELDEAQFLVGVTQIQKEIAGIKNEQNAGLAGIEMHKEIRILERQRQAYQRMAHERLEKISEAFHRRVRDAEELQRLVLGLDSVRLLCRVERGRLGDKMDGLGAISERLDDIHGQLERQLKKVNTLARDISSQASQCRSGKLTR